MLASVILLSCTGDIQTMGGQFASLTTVGKTCVESRNAVNVSSDNFGNILAVVSDEKGYMDMSLPAASPWLRKV